MIYAQDIENKKINNPKDMVEILQTILKRESEIDRNKEHFWTIGLNSAGVVVYIELVSLGTLNMTIVAPRETFRFAIMKGVASIIVAHNHPSGNLRPSMEDFAFTKRLIEAGKIIEIPLTDHIIITENRYVSFREEYPNDLNW